MFLETSRYYKQKTIDTMTPDGRTVKALTLRKIPSLGGNEMILDGTDRLDIIAHRKYGNPAMIWHIGDANTELDIKKLEHIEDKPKIVIVPEK